MKALALLALALGLYAAPLRAQEAGVPTLAVLVHGMSPDPRDFDALEARLRARGWQVRRFHYDDALPLDRSADLLVDALRPQLDPARRLVVVAHSMGGLVARRAMTQGRAATLAGGPPIELVTIASPFGGLVSANFARFMPAPKRSYRDLGTGAAFIEEPGRLGANIRHLKIETDEAGKGEDEVLSLENQRQPAVDEDPQVLWRRTLAAGHVGALQQLGSF